MPCYFVARITISNPSEYQKYLDRAGQVFSKFKGTYLAVDNMPEILEGEWSCTRTVLIQFPDQENFNAWYYSKEYQEILSFRINASECHSILLHGL